MLVTHCILFLSTHFCVTVESAGYIIYFLELSAVSSLGTVCKSLGDVRSRLATQLSVGEGGNRWNTQQDLQLIKFELQLILVVEQ